MAGFDKYSEERFDELFARSKALWDESRRLFLVVMSKDATDDDRAAYVSAVREAENHTVLMRSVMAFWIRQANPGGDSD